MARAEGGAAATGVAPEEWRDWAGGLPALVLGKVVGKVVAQNEAGWAAKLRDWACWGWSEGEIQQEMEERKQDGNCLFVFARVCKEWWKAQIKVGGPLCTRVRSDVILLGSVALAKWALAEGCPREDQHGFNMADCAALFGHIELVQYLIQRQGFAMDENVMMWAARSGNLELVRWLRGEGCPWDRWTCNFAASAGQLGILQWLRANGCPWDARTCNEAAKCGHLETLRWAREHGCDWDAAACYNAAEGGQLEVLQWLRAEGCPWDWTTCQYAVQQRHVEVLRWARENGCPWHDYTRDRAAAELGYTDDFGNLVDLDGYPI